MFEIFKKGSENSKDGPEVSCCAIIVAAGNGERMKTNQNKQFVEIAGRPLVSYTLEAFEACSEVDEIIIVTKESDILLMKDIVDAFEITKAKKIITGGKTRQASVGLGLLEVPSSALIVAIHDGARPFVSPTHIENVINAAKETGGAALAVKMKDTIKLSDNQSFIIKTLDRRLIWSIQTPQCFKLDVILKAYDYAKENKLEFTDDTALLEEIGEKVLLVEGDYDNIKITTPEDIFVAERILAARGELICE